MRNPNKRQKHPFLDLEMQIPGPVQSEIMCVDLGTQWVIDKGGGFY